MTIRRHGADGHRRRWWRPGQRPEPGHPARPAALRRRGHLAVRRAGRAPAARGRHHGARRRRGGRCRGPRARRRAVPRAAAGGRPQPHVSGRGHRHARGAGHRRAGPAAAVCRQHGPLEPRAQPGGPRAAAQADALDGSARSRSVGRSSPSWSRRAARAAPVDLIYNGVDLEAYEYTEACCTLPEEYGFPEGTPLVGVVARLEPEKGHAHAARGLAAGAGQGAARPGC